jgi:chromosomal replication initiation ATPase DnaA
MKQLTLPFAAPAAFAAQDFCAAPSNAAARALLAAADSWSGGRLVLWGPAGAGKTHLLHIWARDCGAALLPGPTLTGIPPACGPVAIDDADITPDPRALLHLLNSTAEAGHPALLTARLAPARQPIKLADLASRLRAASAVEIRAPEDELLAQLLTRLRAPAGAPPRRADLSADPSAAHRRCVARGRRPAGPRRGRAPPALDPAGRRRDTGRSARRIML